jgi:uncharacterized protein
MPLGRGADIAEEVRENDAMKHITAVLLCCFALATTSGITQAATPLKIVVYGGTGWIGSGIVAEALHRGHIVTVAVRDTSGIKEAKGRLHVVVGDVLDMAQVKRTIAGADVVVCAVSFRAPTPDYAAYRRAAESLVGALRSLQPRPPHLIIVGGASSLETSQGVLVIDTFPPHRRCCEVLGQKEALDFYRTVQDVPWSYFSPAFHIAPGARTGKFRLGGDQLIVNANGDSRISMEDYAMAVIDEAEMPAHLRQRFTIGY